MLVLSLLQIGFLPLRRAWQILFLALPSVLTFLKSINHKKIPENGFWG
jgi:hypothetical protein